MTEYVYFSPELLSIDKDALVILNDKYEDGDLRWVNSGDGYWRVYLYRIGVL